MPLLQPPRQRVGLQAFGPAVGFVHGHIQARSTGCVHQHVRAVAEQRRPPVALAGQPRFGVDDAVVRGVAASLTAEVHARIAGIIVFAAVANCLRTRQDWVGSHGAGGPGERREPGKGVDGR